MAETKNLSASHVTKDVVNIVTAIQEWHAHRIAQLQVVIATPEGTKIEIQSGNGEKVELTGKARAGFMAGIHTALMLFEKFPLQIHQLNKSVSEGIEAWCDGLEIGDCPYAEGTDEAAQWKAGWTSEEEGSTDHG
jgi:hypothetical protein